MKKLIDTLLILMIAAIPLVVDPRLNNAYHMPKMLLLLAGCALIGILWLWDTKKKLS